MAQAPQDLDQTAVVVTVLPQPTDDPNSPVLSEPTPNPQPTDFPTTLVTMAEAPPSLIPSPEPTAMAPLPPVITSASSTPDSTSSQVLPTGAPDSSGSGVVITAVNSNNLGAGTGLPRLSALPTLSGTNLPLPTVGIPDEDYSFVNQSNLPEGTVFIAVGAIIGGIAVLVFAWNIATVIIYKRNVKKFQSIGVYKNEPLTSPFHDPKGSGETLVSDNLEHHHHGLFGHKRDESLSRTMTSSGLFFSPTAQVINSASGRTNTMTSTMGSTTAGVGIMGVGSLHPGMYLPVGYYHSGSDGKSVRRMSMHSVSSASLLGTPNLSLSKTPSRSLTPPRLVPPSTAQATETFNLTRSPSEYLDTYLGDKA